MFSSSSHGPCGPHKRGARLESLAFKLQQYNTLRQETLLVVLFVDAFLKYKHTQSHIFHYEAILGTRVIATFAYHETMLEGSIGAFSLTGMDL